MLIKGDGLRIRITLDEPSTCRYCGCELAESMVSDVFSNRSWYIPNGLRWVKDYRNVTIENDGTYILCDNYPTCCGVDPLERDKPKRYFMNRRITPFENGGVVEEKTAIFSDNNKYRYQLYRCWDSTKEKVAFLMLNPSVANGTDDDATTHRCIEFAKKFGYGGLYIVNLYAYIDTNKENLKNLTLEEARGPENQAHIEHVLGKVSRVIYAYGTAIIEQGPEPEWLKPLVADPYCLEVTRDGFPGHPGRISKDATLQKFRGNQLISAASIPLPPSPPPEPEEHEENKNDYIKFLKEQHPIVKAANPTLEPKEIITKIGHIWSLKQMTIEVKNGNVFVNHKNKKLLLDGCGKPQELKAYLDAYRAKYGDEALYNFVDNLPKL